MTEGTRFDLGKRGHWFGWRSILVALFALGAVVALLSRFPYDLETQRQSEILQGLKSHGVFGIGLTGNMNTPFFHRVHSISFDDPGGSTFSDLSVLVQMTNLRHLNLCRTQIRDFSALKELSKLTTLELEHTAIDDLSPIRELTNLTWLDLGSTQVDDTDLKQLEALTSLQVISLHDTNVTDEGAARLQQMLPPCTILIDRPMEKR